MASRRVAQKDSEHERFHEVCSAVLEALVSPKDTDMGILGDISTYFGVIESNSRGMHGFLWLTGKHLLSRSKRETSR